MFAVNKHDDEGRRKECGRDGDGMEAEPRDAPVAEHGSTNERKDHAEIEHTVFQKAAVMRDDEVVHVLQRGTQVADAHGGCDAMTVYLTEALDLHSAGKRGQAVCRQIERGR